MSRLQWMDEALCQEVGLDIFFPETNGESLEARKICSLCNVKDECLEYAMQANVVGVWGGTTSDQRQKMKRAAYRKLAA